MPGSGGLLAATIAALAGWVTLLAVLRTAFRTRDAEAGPGTMEPPGTDPPAVVSFLVHGWSLPRTSVPATLVDLAARGLLAIENDGPDQPMVLLPPPGTPPSTEPLTAYERMVLDHVRDQAVHGRVACAALTTGPSTRSAVWWRRFQAAVVADARRRGLSQPRWPPLIRTALTLTAAVPPVLGGLWLLSILREHSGTSEDPWVPVLMAPLIVWSVLVAVIGWLAGERDTQTGFEAAGRWLGFRRHLAEQSALDEAEPAAVAVRGRYLAWAAALGLALVTLRAIPMGSESDREAWSPVGGRWRLVHISYPDALPPGWGRQPGHAVFSGIAPFAMVFGVNAFAGPEIRDAIREVRDNLGADAERYLDIGFTVTAVVGFLVLARAALLALFGASDLWARRTVRGRIVRLREVRTGKSNRLVRLRIAVDDGSESTIRAWLVYPRFRVSQGDWVTVTVSPRLGYVETIEQQPGPPPRP